MNRKLNVIALLFVLLFSAPALRAQTDTLKQTNNQDSVNKALLQDYQKKLSDIEQQRKSDSLKKTELESQIRSLKTTDNLKKEELQNKLNALKQKEAERLAQKKVQIDSLRKTAKGYPVEGFFKDTLLIIYSQLGSFSAKERAEAVSRRIENLAKDFNFRADSLQTADAETTTDIVYGENIIMSVSESDALWNNTPRTDLAEKYRQIMVSAIKKYKSETSFITLAKEIGLALLVLAVMAALIMFTGKFFRWTALKIHRQEGRAIKGVKIKNYTLLNARREVHAFLLVNTFFKWLSYFLVIYLSLPVLFGIFPWTQNLAQTLFGYILHPVKKILASFGNYLPSLITIIVIIIVFRYVLKGIYFLKTEVEKGNLQLPGFYPDWANPTYQIVRVLVFAFMIVVIFPYLPGSDSQIFKGVSVFLGFLFTFASAGSLSNIIAGIVLTYMRLFKVGDRVKIGEVSGDIVDKSLLVTRIRTIKNEIVSIPNSTVMSSHTVNYSSEASGKGLIVHTTVTIGYDTPWKDMHQALVDAALRTEGILPEPEPFVLQTSLDDFYVSYQINAYTREANKQAFIYSSLHQHIQDVCNERGIEILSPHYRAQRDGSMTTIPASYLSKDLSGSNVQQ